MIKLENTVLPSTEQWEAIIRGTRNPMNSWDKSDSGPCKGYMHDCINCINTYKCAKYGSFKIGPNDKALMTKLARAGSDHSKYRRMIVVYVDITAPLYWWKEFDTYKVGTVANSCSTMHKIHEKEFTLEDFSTEHLLITPEGVFAQTIDTLNELRDLYLGYDGFKYKYGEYDKKVYWDNMIQLLPSSYNQRRTVMFNYQVLANIYPSRKNHKLQEWHDFCDWIKSLPYSELITGEEE
jgi:hypothetical protein